MTEEEQFSATMKTMLELEQPRLKAEERAVKALGQSVGYGRMMHLCEQLWRESLITKHGLPGGAEFSVGPCAGLLVECPCPKSGQDANGHCDWCCGAKRVTRLVRHAALELEARR